MGELANKAGAYGLDALVYGLVNSMELYRQLWPLLLLYLLLAGLAIRRGVEQERQLLALSLCLGSLASVFVLSFAGYAEERCACFGCFAIVSACAVLARAVFREKDLRLWIYIASLAVVLSASYHVMTGLQDIMATKAVIDENIRCISEARAAGEDCALLKAPLPKSKYSAAYGLAVTDKDPDHWTNVYIARYYGIDRVCAGP